MKTYGRDEAEEILRLAGFGDGAPMGPWNDKHVPYGESLIVVNDAGVWPDENLERSGSELDLRWKPCWELDGLPGAPNPRKTPGLPFPFTPQQLAAWMLHGLGWFAWEAIGAVSPDQLLTDPESSWTREAVLAALAERTAAERKVGPAHPGPAAAEDDARRRLAEFDRKCDDNYEAALSALQAAQAEAAAARAEWRREMVRLLIGGSVPAPVFSIPVRGVQASRAQEDAVLAAFEEDGQDPLRVPRPMPGRASPAAYSTDRGHPFQTMAGTVPR